MQKFENAFGKNDIRGIYGEDITEELYYNTAIGFVEWLKKQSSKKEQDITITVVRDARLHSKPLEDALVCGFVSKGVNVITLGLAPTPIGYYSEAAGVNGKDITASAIITASHNPKEYNGLKMTYAKQTLDEEQIKEVKELTFANWKNYVLSTDLSVQSYNIIPDYINDMYQRFNGAGKGVKVVVDSANATGGVVAPELYRKIGCEVIELFSEPDGNFPNHHPNPSVEKTLDTLKETVLKEKADIGIAFDGDSDRIGIIDNNGKFLTGDKLLYIYAIDLIENCKQENIVPNIVSEVKCSQVLYDEINKSGGNAIMCKTGHGYIKSKMKEINALLAGEMSGHTFFKDRYYGFDDAVYAGCRIIEIVSKNKKINSDFQISDTLKPFDNVCSSPEVRYSCPNELKKSTLKAVEKTINDNKNIFGTQIKDIITLDGMRIVFNGGFALIRQSNTEPVFTLRFEAKTKDECERFKKVMTGMLDEILQQNLTY